LEQFITEKKATKYELIENYRSKNNLVEFTNGFVKTLRHRLKETPIAAKQQVNGNIKLVRYQSRNLITPLVNDILSTALSGTTCVLAKTNEEALQITGLLLKNQVQAKLIQSNDGFNLYNLFEVRFFLNEINSGNDVILISTEIWDNAKKTLKNRFQRSSRLEICENLIKDFEATNPKQKYKSDLEVFIKESKLEDFIGGNSETIYVSTIHKAKGKEFDTIFIILDNFNPSTDEAKRQLYVAMTRAKQNLIVHLNGNYLDGITAENLERIDDRIRYSPPSQLAMQLTHKDVNLGYFEFIQKRLKTILSGDILTFTNEDCTNLNGDLVSKFSGKFIETIKAQEGNGYKLTGAKVNFMLYWKKPDEEQEFQIILPELLFER